jgi:diaminopimelate epimerase
MKKAPAKQVIALPFYKVHGAGNDMLVFFRSHFPLAARQKSKFIRLFAHRNYGLGSDQVVEVLSLNPLAIQIWNCDGSKAEMCANGSRSFLFLADQEAWIPNTKTRIPLIVSGVQYEGVKKSSGAFEFALGRPKIVGIKTLKLDGSAVPFFDVNIGNPHAVIFTKRGKIPYCKVPKNFDYRHYGQKIEPMPIFPNKTNVEFVRDWKVKKTQSCGSGAVAVAAVFRRYFGCKVVSVRMTNFKLLVRFDNEIASLSGPCEFIAKGTFSFQSGHLRN